MSHYDCVLPVDFERLSNVVLPAWLEFIAGEREPRSFAEEFAPWQGGIIAELYFWEHHWIEPFSVPNPVIKWFRQHEMSEWQTDTIQFDLSVELTDQLLSWCAENLLMLVIQQSAAIEISGDDCFEDHSILDPFTTMRFYGRLHKPPCVQVAGTKNYFRFLNELYLCTGKASESRYIYARKSVVSEETYDLLDRLFLSVRAFPGVRLLHNLTTFASDDPAITGFLSPVETQCLAAKIPELYAVLDGGPDKPWDFDLFADRLRRSADCGAGLVTLFGGL